MAESPRTEKVVSRRIAQALRAEILDGRLAPGARIRQEDLAQRFGASRIPVREALQILHADGLLTLIANSGAWVYSLSEAECAEQYEIRERIEPLLLRMSIPRLGTGAVEQMAELATRMEAVPAAEIDTFPTLDREFHLLSYSGAETLMLSGLVERFWDTTQHYRRAFTQLVGASGLGVAHLEHHLLVEAIRRADSADAELVLLMHIRRTRVELARHPELFRPRST